MQISQINNEMETAISYVPTKHEKATFVNRSESNKKSQWSIAKLTDLCMKLFAITWCSCSVAVYISTEFLGNGQSGHTGRLAVARLATASQASN